VMATWTPAGSCCGKAWTSTLTFPLHCCWWLSWSGCQATWSLRRRLPGAHRRCVWRGVVCGVLRGGVCVRVECMSQSGSRICAG
jgi:hypothetical protein